MVSTLLSSVVVVAASVVVVAASVKYLLLSRRIRGSGHFEVMHALTPPSENDLNIQSQTRIIESKDLRSGKSLKEPRRARVLPNQPLQATFGLDNIFTTEDGDRGNHFRRQAISVMRKAIGLPKIVRQDERPADWSAVIRHIRSTVQQELTNPDCSINIANLVQFVTLNVSLKYLFDVPDAILTANKLGIKFIAKRSNELWVKSKETPAPNWASETTMHSHLLTITGLDAMTAEKNPMNLILPAYDTMWRAVYRGILEIYFRDPSGSNPVLWQDTLATYLADQKPDNWEKSDDVFQLCAIDVIKEVMRLYPPTRRIYRQYPVEGLLSADLEMMHRNLKLGGHDPERFRPHRWVQIKQVLGQGERLKELEEGMGFMPFAKVCPAGKLNTQAFGWKMIALLIAVLIEGFKELDGDWGLRARGKGDEIPELGKAFKSGRKDCLTLVYENFDLSSVTNEEPL